MGDERYEEPYIITDEQIAEFQKNHLKGKKMRVRYWWSEDGECELCDYEKTITIKQERCYHCDNDILDGAECVKLTTVNGEVYLLHESCARKGIG